MKDTVRFSREWVTRNFWLKALSVLLAAFLWHSVNFTGSSEVAVEAPVRFDGIPERYEMLWQSNRTVTVWLTGKRRAIRLVNPEQIVASIDLSHAKSGESFHQLGFANLSLPAGIKATKISPNVIRVHLEQIISKQLKVHPILEGKPRTGYEVTHVDVIPEMVAVKGLRRFLRNEKEIHTAPISIGDLSANATFSAALEANGTSLRAETSEVTVTVTVQPVEKAAKRENQPKREEKKR